jgi:hypothetical protein
MFRNAERREFRTRAAPMLAHRQWLVRFETEAEMKLIGRYVTATFMIGMALASTASARGISAFSGRPDAGGEWNCFNVNFNEGWVTNVCAESHDFEIPLHTDSNGLKSIDLALHVTNTATTLCRGVAVSRTGTGISATNFISPTVAFTPTSIILTKTTSPQAPVVVSKGLLVVDCILGSGGSLIQADWIN